MFGSLQRDGDDLTLPKPPRPSTKCPSLTNSTGFGLEVSSTEPIVLEGNSLRIGPSGDCLRCTFQKTNRLPYEGGPFPLPPGLGTFPLKEVREFENVCPLEWLQQKDSIFFPMNEREAFWISFSNGGRYAKAVKFAAGCVNAISGEIWVDELQSEPMQDYLVIGLPEASQPWLDGHYAGEGFIRQFVATPKGAGLSVEAQVTGEEKHGGIQMLVYWASEENPEVTYDYGGFTEGGGGLSAQCTDDYDDCDMLLCECAMPAQKSAPSSASDGRRMRMAAPAVPVPEGTDLGPAPAIAGVDEEKVEEEPEEEAYPRPDIQEMCLAAGGKMRQEIVKDPKDISFWSTKRKGRVWIRIVSPEGFETLTREVVAAPPPAWKSGSIPNVGAGHSGIGEASEVLSGVKSLGQMDEENKIGDGRIKYAFRSQGGDELTVREGEEVSVLQIRDQWALVKNQNGDQGFVPTEYVHVLEGGE